jgi:hypothetical protein
VPIISQSSPRNADVPTQHPRNQEKEQGKKWPIRSADHAGFSCPRMHVTRNLFSFAMQCSNIFAFSLARSLQNASNPTQANSCLIPKNKNKKEEKTEIREYRQEQTSA